MDFFQVILLLTGITGGGFIVYSIVNFHGKKQPDEAQMAETMNIDRKITEFDSTIKDADDLYNNLDNLKNDVMKEFDQKYQEMLFLYNLIDDKKKELADIDSTPVFREPPKAEYTPPVNEKTDVHDSFDGGGTPPPYDTDSQQYTNAVRPITQSAIRNPRLEQIMKLKEQGQSVSDIAKNLNMGKGEVMLLLNINNM